MKLITREVSRRELRDALRLGLQSAAAAAVTFTALKALDLDERFVGVISAVLVVQPSVGRTVDSGLQRIAATVVGSLVGLACLFALPVGYGTIVALAVSMLVMNCIAGIWPEWKYGAVAAVALALGSEGDAYATAKARALSIGLGAALGAATTLVVWPDSAKQRAEEHLGRALRAAADRLEAVLAAVQSDAGDTGEELADGYHAAIADARSAASGVQLADQDALKARIRHAERFYNSILILKRVAGEDTNLEDEDAEFAERFEATAKLGCRIARDLADGNGDGDDTLEELRETLEETQRSELERTGDPERTLRHSALLFGIDEVEDSLRKLLGIDDEDRSLIDFLKDNKGTRKVKELLGGEE